MLSEKKFFGRKAFIKTALLIMSAIILTSSFFGGTLAWLITKTDPVINTFTYGDVNITIAETDTNDGDDDKNTNTYSMVPGGKITKDPFVTVKAESEDCWLFVKLEKSIAPSSFDSFMEFQIAEGWTALEGKEGVYYREVDKKDSDQGYYVIKDNAVNVKGEVTKEMLNCLIQYPTLSITAYAVQRDSTIEAIDTAEEAWAIINQ